MCKKKMTTLMACFRREKAKIKKSMGTGKGSNEVYSSSWFAFQRMQFLYDKDKPRETRSTVTLEGTDTAPTEGEEEIANQEEIEENNPHDEDISQNANKFSSPHSKIIPPRKRKIEDQRLNEAYKILQTCASDSTNDESQDFGNLVATKLRKYDKLTQSIVQNEIMNIFLNADRGFHKQTHCQSSLYRPHYNSNYTAQPQETNFYQYQSPNTYHSPNLVTESSYNVSPQPFTSTIRQESLYNVSPQPFTSPTRQEYSYNVSPQPFTSTTRQEYLYNVSPQPFTSTTRQESSYNVSPQSFTSTTRQSSPNIPISPTGVTSDEDYTLHSI
ncbi:uncharacterized protein LOC143904798 [Temnothorax americanus]|uniref:uncharacterized protein LOC143904798 n=1 Tax=Temnothorax americanus TaxID=1964332 RepID=UPI004068D9D1